MPKKGWLYIQFQKTEKEMKTWPAWMKVEAAQNEKDETDEVKPTDKDRKQKEPQEARA